MRRFVIAGLKANCARCLLNITKWPCLHKGARSAACGKPSSAPWSGGCEQRRSQVQGNALTCLKKPPKHCAAATVFWSAHKANLFFLTKRITKMQHAVVDVAAERIAAALTEADTVDVSSIFSETLNQMLAEPVAATLRSLGQTREALARVMDVVGW